jgi:hypothetical protein
MSNASPPVQRLARAMMGERMPADQRRLSPRSPELKTAPGTAVSRNRCFSRLLEPLFFSGHLHQGRFKSLPVLCDDHLLALQRYVWICT